MQTSIGSHNPNTGARERRRILGVSFSNDPKVFSRVAHVALVGKQHDANIAFDAASIYLERNETEAPLPRDRVDVSPNERAIVDGAIAVANLGL